MSNQAKQIKIIPSWRTAAAIIAAALEDGTEEGKKAARKELFRMADMLDEINAQAAQ